jgi:TRAP-type transport system small permease protein
MGANWDERTTTILRHFSSGCLVLLAVVLLAVVSIRFLPWAKLSWSDEIVEWAFAWMVFVGSAALWKHDQHFRLDFLLKATANRPSGRWLRLFIEISNLFFLGVFTYYSYFLTVRANDRSPILEWPKPVWYGCIPLAGTVMLACTLRNLYRLTRPAQKQEEGGQAKGKS